jgi:16S rRNA (uracil1498-N3)-methyltransferase
VTIHRFFVPPAEAVGDRFPIPAATRRHLAVLRVRDADPIVLLTGDGTELLARIEGRDVVVEDRRPAAGEPRHAVTIVQSLLKGDGLDEVVDRTTELGAARIRLVVTERCVVRDVPARRMDRLRRIAAEAAARSERGRVPIVEGPVRLDDVLDRTTVVLLERQEGGRLVDLPPPAALVVGPEGGFGPADREAIGRAGAPTAWLGPRILRGRSVGVAALAAVLASTGDFA